MNSKKLLHISFVDDSLVASEAGETAVFDDSLVLQAVGGYFDDLTIESFRVYDLEPVIFPDVRDYAGIVIGGSGHFVREADQLLWMNDIAEFIQRAKEAGIPLLGICFGHQLIAHVLGGVIKPFAEGRRDFGVVRMQKLNGADTHILFQNIPDVFDALASHGDYIHELPAGARALARSEGCHIEAAEFGHMTYGVQFHPEYTPEIMLDLARQRIVDEVSRNRFAAGLSYAPHATQVLRNFIQHAIGD